jgi:hypothetical protein
MGVDVDEAGADDAPVGVDGAVGGTVHLTHRHDAIPSHRHVTTEGGGTGAVHHRSVLDDQVEGHRCSVGRGRNGRRRWIVL